MICATCSSGVGSATATAEGTAGTSASSGEDGVGSSEKDFGLGGILRMADPGPLLGPREIGCGKLSKRFGLGVVARAAGEGGGEVPSDGDFGGARRRRTDGLSWIAAAERAASATTIALIQVDTKALHDSNRCLGSLSSARRNEARSISLSIPDRLGESFRRAESCSSIEPENGSFPVRSS